MLGKWCMKYKSVSVPQALDAPPRHSLCSRPYRAPFRKDRLPLTSIPPWWDCHKNWSIYWQLGFDYINEKHFQHQAEAFCSFITMISSLPPMDSLLSSSWQHRCLVGLTSIVVSCMVTRALTWLRFEKALASKAAERQTPSLPYSVPIVGHAFSMALNIIGLNRHIAFVPSAIRC